MQSKQVIKLINKKHIRTLKNSISLILKEKNVVIKKKSLNLEVTYAQTINQLINLQLGLLLRNFKNKNPAYASILKQNTRVVRKLLKQLLLIS